MFDIGWSEMAVIALIALIVIGPKELPQAMRMAAKWVRKARGLAREFQSGVDEMIREAELEDARKAVESARHLDMDKTLESAVDPTGSVRAEQRDLETAAKADAAATDAKSTDADGPEQRAEGAEEKQGATVVTQPLNIAPPHSLTPPSEVEISAPEPSEGSKDAPDDEPTRKRVEGT